METLRKILKKKGIPQKKVADALGIHVSVIARYDDLSKRSLDEVLKIAEATGIPFEELAGAKVGTLMDVSNYSGSVNTGNVGGHMVNLADPNVKKIIRGNDIDIERVTPADKDRQVIDVLKARISDLEKLVDAKDALIEILNNNLKNKEL